MAAVPSIGRAARVEPQHVDAGATQELYERYAAQIFGFCVNRLGSREEAEDATQSTFLNAHRALKRGVTPEAELAWLYKIAHNVCLTRRRSSYRRNRVESPSDLGAVQDVLSAPTSDSPDELMRLTDALANMPENQRRAILLREWQGLSYHEIARDLGLTQSAVETLIFRARRSLASNLEHEPKRARTLSRARNALDLGTLFAGLKTLFATSAAVKATTTAAVVVSGAAVVATMPEREPRPVPMRPDVPAAVADNPARPTVEVSRSADPRRFVPAAPAAIRPKRNVADARKASKGDRPTPPGQARKAGAVAKEKPAKPSRSQAALARSKAKPVRRAVVAKPPRPVRKTSAVKAKKPQRAVANTRGNSGARGKHGS